MLVPIEARLPSEPWTSSLGVELQRARRAGDLDGCAALLKAHAFDPDGFFCALSLSRSSTTDGFGSWVGALRRSAHVVSSVEPNHLLVLVQGHEATTSPAQLTHLLGASACGIGLRRRGPAGAAETAQEAVEALALAARRGGLVRVEDDWPLLLLLRSLDDVAGYIAPALTFARTRSHLAEAVRAYADAGFSVTGAAQRLYLTPNAVVYRLRQWKTGTGWDPRSYQGLVRSLACLEMLALESSESVPPALAQ